MFAHAMHQGMCKHAESLGVACIEVLIAILRHTQHGQHLGPAPHLIWAYLIEFWLCMFSCPTIAAAKGFPKGLQCAVHIVPTKGASPPTCILPMPVFVGVVGPACGCMHLVGKVVGECTCCSAVQCTTVNKNIDLRIF